MDYDNYIKYKKKYLNLKNNKKLDGGSQKIDKNKKKLKGGGRGQKIDNISWTNEIYICDQPNKNCLYKGQVFNNNKTSELYIEGIWDIKYVSDYTLVKEKKEILINALFNMKNDKNKKMLEWRGSYDENENFTGSLRHLPMYVAEIYEFKINNYTNITVEKDNNMDDENDPDNNNYKYSCDNIDDNIGRLENNAENTIDNTIDNKMVKNLYNLVYLIENPKTIINDEDSYNNNNNFYNNLYEEHNEVNIKNYCIDVLDKINELTKLYQDIIQLDKNYPSYIKLILMKNKK